MEKEVHGTKGFTWCLPELQVPSGEGPEFVFQEWEEGHAESDGLAQLTWPEGAS